MLTVIKTPTVIESVGNKPKRIEEYVGRVNSDTEALSIAKMMSPAGWEEPGQTPEFDEYTLVLSGMLRLETADGIQDVCRRTGGDSACRAMGPLLYARGRGSGIRGYLPTGFLTGNGPPGLITRTPLSDRTLGYIGRPCTTDKMCSTQNLFVCLPET